jgi:hypothetical protein
MSKLKIFTLTLLFIQNILNAQHQINCEAWTAFVPSDKLPKGLKIMKGNNNLDAIKYKEKYYVAFRTAPSHFASKKTRLYIISSSDLKKWEFEKEYHLKADMREPRFVTFRDTLFFYFFEGGTKMTKFEPRHIWMSKSSGKADWADIKNIGLDGYVPWRFRQRNDKIYLSAYYGVGIYKNHTFPDLRLYTSTDGTNFKPISEQTQIASKGAEEGEFEFDSDGNLWATVRLEGSGSYIAYAHRDSLHHWHTKFGKHKYDSALMLNHEDTMYVFARRHLKGDATQHEFPSKKQRRKNLVRYSFSKKKTALYRLNKEKLILEHIMDFPSTGDNAFPAIAKIDNNRYLLLNYSSNIHKKDKNWIGGQLRKTYIYTTILSIE